MLRLPLFTVSVPRLGLGRQLRNVGLQDRSERPILTGMSVFVDGKTKLTYEDFRHFPDDGMRHEIIDGVHYMSPAPGTPHQSASRHIQFALYRHIEENGLGQVYDAPTDLQLSDVDVVEPDLIIVLSENRHIILPSRIRGVPDLVVEILSPSTSERDRTLKHALYEHHGIPEYWVVDIEERLVERYRLAEGQYGEPTEHRESIAFAGATVDLLRVWSRLGPEAG